MINDALNYRIADVIVEAFQDTRLFHLEMFHILSFQYETIQLQFLLVVFDYFELLILHYNLLIQGLLDISLNLGLFILTRNLFVNFWYCGRLR